MNKYISKFLSIVLRHNTEKIGLKLNKNGWANVEELLAKSKKIHPSLDFDLLKEVVDTNDKKRFAFNEDYTKIRANQGHSVKVDLQYVAKQPPEFLYHGTAPKFIEAIKEKGLLKMNRHHVHCSEERDTATKVGARRGKPIILAIRAGAMHTDGIEFFQSNNGVWLTDNVPPEYIEFKS